MTGHTRWETMTWLPDDHARRIRIAYVDGYLLALEDMLKDMELIQFDDLPPAATFAVASTLRRMREVIALSQRNSRTTRDQLTKKDDS